MTRDSLTTINPGVLKRGSGESVVEEAVRIGCAAILYSTVFRAEDL